MTNDKFNFKKGYTLIEALVAISIFSVSILGLLIALSQGISDTGYAKKKVAAAYLAAEGIECVRNTRDTYVLYPDATHSWNQFKVLDPGDIACPAVLSGFTRQIQMEEVGPSRVKVTSTVAWTQGSGTYDVSFSESLFDWIE